MVLSKKGHPHGVRPLCREASRAFERTRTSSSAGALPSWGRPCDNLVTLAMPVDVGGVKRHSVKPEHCSVAGQQGPRTKLTWTLWSTVERTRVRTDRFAVGKRFVNTHTHCNLLEWRPFCGPLPGRVECTVGRGGASPFLVSRNPARFHKPARLRLPWSKLGCASCD